jgi:hypothetical protein
VLRNRTAGFPAAEQELSSQLLTSHRQLGFDHYKAGHYATASLHFREALRYRKDFRGVAYVIQAWWQRVRQSAARAY